MTIESGPRRRVIRPDEWVAISRALDAAFDLPESERDAFIRREYAHDPALLVELLRILAGSGLTDATLDRPAWAGFPQLLEDESSPPFELPVVLANQFRLDREIGRGGMGIVFLGHDLRHDRQVAVKVLRPTAHAAGGIARFLLEIRTTARLRHANIVPLFDSGEIGESAFFVMPYLEGESLRARLGTSSLTMREIVRVLGDVARALQYAHEHGVVHRDIKPDNVLLSGGTAVVTDFGIAKALSASRTNATTTLTDLGTTVGTPAYMAPEQAAGDPNIDHRADIYSFGCMAYELLGGRQPFAGRAPQRVLAAHLSELPQPIGELNPDIAQSLAELVMRCLEKSSDARPQSASELVRTLDAVTSGPIDHLPAVDTRRVFQRAIVLFVAATVLVGIVATIATRMIGLPDWVVPGAMIVMALGLPVVVFAGYVESVTHHGLTATPRGASDGSSQRRRTLRAFAMRLSPHVTWRRVTRGGVYALGAFAALIAGVMATRALGIGPAASLLGSGRLKQRDAIIVADFRVSHADASVGTVVAEAVRMDLGESSSITVTSPEAVAGALQRMKRPANSVIDESLARQIAVREGIKAVVGGTVTGLGAGFVVRLEIISADSGIVLASYPTTVDSPKELVDGVDRVARKLRGKIGESLKSVHANPPLAQVVTASLAALTAYTIGNRANDIDRDYPKAIAALRQAVAIDTGFAMAWRKLGVALGNVGAPQSAVDSALTNAHRFVDRRSTNEASLADAYYYEVGPGRDLDKGIALYEAMLDRGDSSQAVLNNLGLDYEIKLDYAHAELMFRAAMAKYPGNTLSYRNLGVLLAREGRWSEIRPLIDTMQSRFPGNTSMYNQAANLLYHNGDDTRFEHAIDSMVAAKSADLKRIGLRLKSRLTQLHGRITQGLRWAAAANTADSMGGVRRRPLSDSIQNAFADVWWREHPASAVRRVDAALAAQPITSLPEPDRPYLEAARVYALAGRPDRARAMLAQRATQLHDTSFIRASLPRLHDAEGEIALAEGRARDAIELFRKGNRVQPSQIDPDLFTMSANLARAFDLANMPDSAIAYFEKYENTNDGGRILFDMYYLPGAYKRLGELYEGKGDTAKAELYLGKFIDLWKQADPELQSKVTDARKLLARLRIKSG